MATTNSQPQVIKSLGQGSYAQVDLVRTHSGGQLARKWIPLRYSASILKERRILEEFSRCPRTVRFHGSEICFREEENSWVHDLYLEYADGGTFHDVKGLDGGRIAAVHHVRAYARMILAGLECMHRKGYVHCDLRPRNILAFSTNHNHNFPGKSPKNCTSVAELWESVLNANNEIETPKNICTRHETSGLIGLTFDTDNATNPSVSSKPNPVSVPWELKLADFGLTKEPLEELGEKSTMNWTPEYPFQGTPSYQSPESVKGMIGPEMDIWALGCVVMEMLTWKVMSEESELDELIEELGYGEGMPEMPKGLSYWGKDFLGFCFQRDPRFKPSASTLLFHPWILGLVA